MSVLSDATVVRRGVGDAVEHGARTILGGPAFTGAVAVAKGVVALYLLSAGLDPVLFAIGFLAAVTVYTHNRLTDVGEDAVNRPESASVAATRPRLLGAVAGGAYLVALVLAALGGLLAVALVLLPGVAGALYSEEWLPVSEADRLKEVPFVNTGVVAGAWAVSLAYLPLAFASRSAGATALAVAGYMFLRTGAASAVLDVRDVPGDRHEGIPTIPVVLGVDRTRRLLYALDALSAALLAGGVAAGVLPAGALVLLLALPYSAALTGLLGSGADLDRVALAKDGEYVLMALLVAAIGAPAPA